MRRAVVGALLLLGAIRALAQDEPRRAPEPAEVAALVSSIVAGRDAARKLLARDPGGALGGFLQALKAADGLPPEPRARVRAALLLDLGQAAQHLEPERVLLKDGSQVAGEFADGARHGRPDDWIVRATLDARRKLFTVKKSDVASGPAPFGGLERARSCYEEVLRIDPRAVKARSNLALCCIQSGVSSTENARNLEKGPAGETDQRRGQREALLRQLRAMALDSFTAGERHLLTLAAQDPKDRLARSNLANLYFGYMDRIDDAVTRMEEVVAIEDAKDLTRAVFGEILLTRARARAKKNDREGARADYGRACKEYRAFLELATNDPNVAHIRERLREAEGELAGLGPAK